MDEKRTEVDAESATPAVESSNDDHKTKRRMVKLAILTTIVAVFLLFVGLVFGLVILKVKSPKFTLDKKNFNFQSFSKVNSSSSTSFNIIFSTQVRIFNPNFGPYRFDNTSATFTAGGATVGHVIIPKGRVGGLSTKKIDVIVSLSSSQLPNSAESSKELSSGMLTLGATAELTGKVKAMGLVKTKRVAYMKCTLVIETNQGKLRSLKCKTPPKERRTRPVHLNL